MKRFKIVASLLLIIAIFSSCDRDFLDKDPLDRLSSGQFWQSKADFDMALTALYGSMQNPMFSAGAPDWDLLTDNGYGQHNSNGSQAIVRGDIFSSSGGYISDVYRSCYEGIARVNIFLAKLEEFQGEGITEEVRNLYRGEAIFIRAFYYYYL